jgi:hypothetical protein
MDRQDRQLRQQIIEAIKARDLTDTEAWNDLSALSTDTQLDTIETFDDEIRIEDGNFSGPLTWYVSLRYGQEGTDNLLVMSESFPGSFEGHLEDGRPVIDRMFAAVSSFYA